MRNKKLPLPFSDINQLFSYEREQDKATLPFQKSAITAEFNQRFLATSREFQVSNIIHYFLKVDFSYQHPTALRMVAKANKNYLLRILKQPDFDRYDTNVAAAKGMPGQIPNGGRILMLPGLRCHDVKSILKAISIRTGLPVLDPKGIFQFTLIEDDRDAFDQLHLECRILKEKYYHFDYRLHRSFDEIPMGMDFDYISLDVRGNVFTGSLIDFCKRSTLVKPHGTMVLNRSFHMRQKPVRNAVDTILTNKYYWGELKRQIARQDENTLLDYHFALDATIMSLLFPTLVSTSLPHFYGDKSNSFGANTDYHPARVQQKVRNANLDQNDLGERFLQSERYWRDIQTNKPLWTGGEWDYRADYGNLLVSSLGHNIRFENLPEQEAVVAIPAEVEDY